MWFLSPNAAAWGCLLTGEQTLAEKSKHWALPSVLHQFWRHLFEMQMTLCWYGQISDDLPGHGRQWPCPHPCRNSMIPFPGAAPILHVPAPPPTLLCPVCPTATVEQPHGLRNWSPPKIISSKNYQLLSPDWVIFHLSPFYLAMPLHELQTLILKVKVATPTS